MQPSLDSPQEGVSPEDQETFGQQTMSIKIRCKVCQAGLKLPEAAMGKVVKCPKCANKIKVPSAPAGAAGQVAGAGSPSGRRRSSANASASTNFFTALSNLPLEDQERKICPRCGKDVDPEIGECPDCGIDVETGQLTKERKREIAVKGVDPLDYYGTLTQDFFAFPFKHPELIVKTMFLSAASYFILAWARFFIFFTNGKTVHYFMYGFVSVASALFIGWFWGLATQSVDYAFASNAAIKKKKKPKPFGLKPGDPFKWFEYGYRFMIWVLCNLAVYNLVVSPILIGLGFIVLFTGASPNLFAFSVLAVCGIATLFVVLSLPIALGHMAMPVTWPGWNPFKLAHLVTRNIGATLVWGVLTLFFLAIPIGAYLAAFIYVSDDFVKVFEPMIANARIMEVKKMNFEPGEKISNELLRLRDMKPDNEVPFMLWLQTEGILLLVASCMGPFLLGSARSIGNLVYFHQNSLDLIRDNPGVKYKILDKRKYLPIPFQSQVGAIWLAMNLLWGFSSAMLILYAVLTGGIMGVVIGECIRDYFFVWIPTIVFMDGVCRVFEKTGHKGIYAILPFVREYLLFKVADLPVTWFLGFFIMMLSFLGGSAIALLGISFPLGLGLAGGSFIGLMVVWIYVCIQIAERFEKPVSYGLGLAFLGPVFFLILGRSLDRAKRLPSDPPPEMEDEGFAR